MVVSVIFVFLMIILLGIFINIFRSTGKKIRNNRIKYAIPAFLNIILDFVIVYFWIRYESIQNIPIFKEYPQLMFAVVGFTLLSLLIYNSRKQKERIICADIASSTVEKVRFQKHSDRKAFDISSESFDTEIEKK